MHVNKQLVSLFLGLITATIMAAGKSYIDVEKMKVRQDTLFDLVKETREDVKYIRRHIPKED